jgi:ketosteroid isomerase-like protein
MARADVRRLLIFTALVVAVTLPSEGQLPTVAPPPVTAPVVVPATPTPAPPLPSVALPPELDRVLRDYEGAWAARNSLALARLFTPDGFAMPNGRPALRGRAAIRAGGYGREGGPLVLRALAFGTEGSSGWIVGGYRPGTIAGYGQSADTGDVGKFVLLLRRGDDGRWLIAADIDNSNSRPVSTTRRPTPTPFTPVVPHR